MTKEEGAGKGVPTNDQIVDDLIKDFEESCDTRERVGASESSEQSKEEDAGPSNVEIDDLVEDKPKQRREDFIDEEEMQKRELTYTDEDKQRLKGEGDELKRQGNELFKSNEYKESIEKYTLGLRTCPLVYTKERAILYANRAAAKINLNDDESALEDCSKAIELEPHYVRAVMRRAQLYESMDRLDESLDDFKKLLELDPSSKEAVTALQRLPPLINERNEKMKQEMMGKLKELGNIVLRPFGLSTENFKMVQDPNTGGYSYQLATGEVVSPPDSFTIYTDGSKLEDGAVGAGIYLEGTQRSISEGLGSMCSVFQAEVCAITEAIPLPEWLDVPERTVIICSDSVAAPKALKAYLTNIALVKECRD